jgi:hypothetical protein
MPSLSHGLYIHRHSCTSQYIYLAFFFPSPSLQLSKTRITKDKRSTARQKSNQERGKSCLAIRLLFFICFGSSNKKRKIIIKKRIKKSIYTNTPLIISKRFACPSSRHTHERREPLFSCFSLQHLRERERERERHTDFRLFIHQKPLALSLLF